jgi:hypothetical protein
LLNSINQSAKRLFFNGRAVQLASQDVCRSLSNHCEGRFQIALERFLNNLKVDNERDERIAVQPACGLAFPPDTSFSHGSNNARPDGIRQLPPKVFRVRPYDVSQLAGLAWKQEDS